MKQLLKYMSVVLFLFACSQTLGQHPAYKYLSNGDISSTNDVNLRDPARVLKIGGRKGNNMTSVGSVIELKAHKMKLVKGTITVWVVSLEELSAFDNKPNFTKRNQNYSVYPFLWDCSNPIYFDKANFRLAWVTRWQPSIIAQFGKGTLYEEAYNIPHTALISVSHFVEKINKRYQFTLSWNYSTDQYTLYVRNYHWQYYCEMADMPNDLQNSALMKNPFLYPLCFGSWSTTVDHELWYKLQFLRIDNKLLGAINGTIMLAFTGDGFNNNRPVFDFGRIAIRCLLHSELLFRNLKVYNQSKFITEKLLNTVTVKK